MQSLKFFFTQLLKYVKCYYHNEYFVQINIKWPSQTRQRELRDDAEPLGKALVRGAFVQIANATFKYKHLKQVRTAETCSGGRKKMIGPCSKKSPS